MFETQRKQHSRIIRLTGAVLLVLFSAADGARTEAGAGENRSFPAETAFKIMILDREKSLGIYPEMGEEEEEERKLAPTAEAWAGLVLANSLIEGGLPERAVPVLEKLAGMQEPGPFSKKVLVALQKALYLEGRYKDSLGVFYKISSGREKPPPQTLLMAGNSYLIRKEYRPALQTLSRISSDRNHYPYALYSMALALSRLEGGGQEPVWTLRKLVRFNHGDDPALIELVNRARLTLAVILKNQNNYPEAINLFGRISPESRFYPEGLYGMGLLFSETGDCVNAIVVFEKLAELSPESRLGLEALYRIGDCYSRLKAFRSSVDRFHVALNKLKDEKDILLAIQNGIRKGEPVSVPGIRRRFLIEDGVGPFEEGLTWSRRFNELAGLETRLEHLAGMTLPAGGGRPPRMESLRIQGEKARDELEDAFLLGVSRPLAERIGWIDDLIQKTTLQMARHLILIQDYETSP